MHVYEEKLKNEDYADKPKRSGGLSYELADPGTRLFALVIDGLVLSLVGGLSFAGSHSDGGFLVGFVISVAYHWYFLTRHDGQTPGKMLMRIRVIKVDGTPLTGADAVVRYIGYYINSFLLGLGWLWALVDSNRQGIHDKLARTYVVKA